MKLLGISGTIIGTKTEIAVQKVLDAAKKMNPDLNIEMLNLKDFDIDFCDGRDPSSYGEDTKKVIKKVNEADYYIIGTPVFQGSITGALKNLFDLLPPDSLKHKVVGFIATGGTFQHYLVIENQLRPIAGYFRSFVAPSYVYLNDSHFNDEKRIVDNEVLKRLENLAEELTFMQTRLKYNHKEDKKSNIL
jgi:FAD reductase [NAD(P)H]